MISAGRRMAISERLELSSDPVLCGLRLTFAVSVGQLWRRKKQSPLPIRQRALLLTRRLHKDASPHGTLTSSKSLPLCRSHHKRMKRL